MENKKFVVAIVILSLLLLAAVGFIGYDKFLKKQDESIKTVIDGNELDLNVFHKIGDVLNNLDNAFNDTFTTRKAVVYSANSENRLCFYVTYNPSGSGLGNCEFNVYIDNIKVQIAN